MSLNTTVSINYYQFLDFIYYRYLEGSQEFKKDSQFFLFQVYELITVRRTAMKPSIGSVRCEEGPLPNSR